MLPILKLLSDRSVWPGRQVTDQLGLTQEERQERTPSGKQTVLRSRVHWATYYLKRAGLLESSQRGAYAITERGLAVLAERPEKLNATYLARFSEFAEWFGKTVPAPPAGPEPAATTAISAPELTPDQRLDQAYAEINESVASELLDRIL